MSTFTKRPFTPPPSLLEATAHSKLSAANILHSKYSNQLNIPIYVTTATQKKKWTYSKGFPDLSLLAQTAQKKVRTPSITLINSTQVQLKAPTIVITPFSDSDCDYDSSSSFTTYPQSISPKEKHENELNIYNANDTMGESTDYFQTDSDDNSNENGYNYPWSTDSDDSFAHLSENEVYEKIKTKFMQTYKPKIDIKINSKLNRIYENKSVKQIEKQSDVLENKYYDEKHGRYLSFIINPTPTSPSTSYSDINDIDETDSMSEYEGDNEDENDLNGIFKHKMVVTPIQSMCNLFDSDSTGCNLTDIDEL